MKLLTFLEDGTQKLGVKVNSGILHIEKIIEDLQLENLSKNIMDVIKNDELYTRLEDLLQNARLEENEKYIVNEKEIIWGPCVTNPNKIICVGLNYRKHADETNMPYPEVPVLFNKFHNALAGNKQNIAIPKMTNKLDYEAELGVVIGKEAKNVTKENALDYVFGYCSANDLSARDLQFKTTQWLLGKTCDDFCPLGPYLVTSSEVGNPNRLEIKTIVNDEVRQSSNTSDMIFPVDEIISFISQHMTLMPGDVILTGTPEGVVMGYPPEKQNYLDEGDEVTVEIEKLGQLTNFIVTE